MRGLLLLLRWSLRDLRANWVKVAAIAVIIGLGTGSYAGLTSSANWRRLSNEASYGLLNVHDLRLRLVEGSTVSRGELEAAARSIEHSAWITGAEERVVVDLLVDAGTAERDILVTGLMVGVDLSGTGPSINRMFNDGGRHLGPDDAGEMVVVLQHSFANHYDLPDRGTLTVGGGRILTYVGHAMQPEFFLVAPEGQILFSEADYAVLFSSIETAQLLSGTDGVNDLVVTLAAGARPHQVAAELEAAIADRTGVGAATELLADNTAYRALTEDVENDQQVFNLFAFLLVGGAVTGAFNLVNRMVERQRREIGAAMALGVPRWRIAFRPLAVGAQIAILGVVLGVVVGIAIGAAMRSVLTEFLPLPVWLTPFQPRVFAGVAAIGFLVPFLAAAWPVWRAVRVRPVDAIRPVHLAGGRARRHRLRRLSLPGDTFAKMPFRNLVRSKRRSITTVLAVAAALVVLVGFMGMIDSFMGTIDRARDEAVKSSPDRLVVGLDGFYEATSPRVTAVTAAASVGRADPGARLGAHASGPGGSLPLLVELLDFGQAAWSPTIASGGTGGIIVTARAATDLGVGVGDTLALRHPVRTGPGSFSFAVAEIPVSGIHPYPLRPFAYMGLEESARFGIEGEVNLLNVIPAAGFTTGDVKRDLLGAEAVTSVQEVAGAVDNIREQMGAVTGILRVVGLAAVLLALLIAFNTASINLDERFRDHATMFAYGVPVRTALRVAMMESAVVGALATTVGIGGGVAMVWWVTRHLLAETLPDLAVEVILNPGTLLVAVAMGLAAVTLAPLFTVPRMRRMDLPGTLRLME